ncbi:MAG: alpha/beta fold hydrolase, partial [Acidimicrobiia bacterium]
MIDPSPFSIERDGLRVAGLDWGGDGPPLLLLHPNGFCAGLFDPLAQRLRDRFRPFGVDLRGHGESDAPASSEGFAFELMAADVLTVLDRLGADEVVALGQSLGGGVATLVDRLRPGVIRKLLLCEAIAFSLPDMPGGVRPPGSGPGDGGNYMSEIARKRGAVWPDRDAVLASYASRPPLDVLAPETLAAYVRWGFHDRPDGQVELACPPDVEATIFEVSSHEQGAAGAWAHLPDLRARTTVVHGTDSDLPAEWFAAQADRADAPLVTLTGGHFFLQEDTARAEQLVR